jgi:hypothetical protein
MDRIVGMVVSLVVRCKCQRKAKDRMESIHTDRLYTQIIQ